LTKRFTTKVYGASQDSIVLKELYGLYAQGQDLSGSGIDLSINYVISGQAQQSEDDPSVPNAIISDFDTLDTGETFLVQQPSFPAPVPYWPVFGSGFLGGRFTGIQCRVSTTSPDFILSGFMITYSNAGLIG
jgi:hypothetical protein